MPGPQIALDPRLVRRLYDRSGAARWGVSDARWAEALAVSARHALGEGAGRSGFRARRGLKQYLEALHLADLALACACAEGIESAWDHFVAELRPVLYRAADALEPGGGARDLADSLYGDLYGLRERGGARQSLFRYFHGRSSLATWLRAMLSQRYVDRVRARSRIQPLPEGEDPPSRGPAPDPDRARYLALVQAALTAALGALADRDRLRLHLYYARQLTLAEVGRLLGEHEATASRHLARTRTAIGIAIERQLIGAGLSPGEMAACLRSVAEDSGQLDLEAMGGGGRPVQAEGG